MKLYLKPRRAARADAAAPPPPATSLLGANEFLVELDSFAGRAATSPSPGAAVTVVADLADDLAEHLRDLTGVARVPRPRAAVFDASAVADRSWHQPVTEAVSSASVALSGHSARRRELWDANQRQFDAQRRISLCRTALRTASRRLQAVADREATRERLAAQGKLRLIQFRTQRR